MFVPPKEYLKVPSRAQLLRSTFRPTDKQYTIVELARLDEDLVAEHKSLEFVHASFRGLLEHSLSFIVVHRVLKIT
jgi:hypothetical protein